MMKILMFLHFSNNEMIFDYVVLMRVRITESFPCQRIRVQHGLTTGSTAPRRQTPAAPDELNASSQALLEPLGTAVKKKRNNKLCGGWATDPPTALEFVRLQPSSPHSNPN